MERFSYYSLFATSRVIRFFTGKYRVCQQVVVRNERYYRLFGSFLNITARAITAIITTAPVASTISVT